MKNPIADEILENILSNKKAYHEYHIEDTFLAGVVLRGTEVKSLRAGKVNFLDAFCLVDKGEVFLKNLHISEYSHGTYNNHEPNRLRKLLLSKREIRKIEKHLEEKGYTLIPLQLFFNKKNLVKVYIGLGKGKKLYDKREDSKEKDAKREIERNWKAKG
jgi:SsrA-binding protein